MVIRELEVKYKNKNKKVVPASSPEAVWKFLLPEIENAAKESFFVLGLDNRNNVHFWEKVSTGIVDQTIVHPREVFVPMLLCGCSSIIIAHNHPAGSLKASAEDLVITERIKKAGEILGIKLLDHVILISESYYSLKENNQL